MESNDDNATRLADESTRLMANEAAHDDDATRVLSPEDEIESELTRRLGGDATRVASSLVDDDEATRVSTAGSVAEDDRTRFQPSNRLDRTVRGFRPGDLIRNRFRLEKKIGQGGMGMVFIARDLRKEEVGDQDSLVAIKLLSDNFKSHPEALRMLQQETRKAQKLAHPNVVTVYDFDRDGETVYMTMEYLTGEPLSEYIEQSRGSRDLEEVLPIVAGIVHGLQYAHERGIVHSDLKPANVFLTEEGTAKILDLGIARAMMEPGKPGVKSGGESFSNESDTQQLFALTPKYASPEMFDGAPPDPRDDIYALACITYELLVGEHPFGGRPANEARDLRLEPKRIPGLSDRQWKAVLAGLALQREQRLASAEEFLQAFLPKKKEPWRWATLGVILITIAVVAYFIMRPPQEVPLSPQDQAIVDQEIQVARQHMEVGSLGNALENYKMILALPPYDKEPPGGGFVQQPYNREAMADLRKLLQEFERQATAMIESGYLEDARAFVQAGLGVDGEHEGLLELKEKLDSMGTGGRKTE